MMGQDDYTIRARITVTDDSGTGTKSAENAVNRVQAAVERASSKIGGMLQLLTGAFGLGALAKGIVQVNSSIDDAANGLASLYAALTGADIGTAVRAARGDLQGLRDDAAKGVGELSDYLESYQRVLAPAMTAGASREAIRELVRNAIATTGALGRELWQAGIDVQQAMTSGVTDRTTPIVAVALAAVGTTSEKFNKLKPAEKIQELNRAFAAFAPGVALMGQSWSAQMSTLQDSAKRLFGLVSRPIFDAWLEGLRRLNRWIEANEETLTRVGKQWGATMLRVWDDLIARAHTYAGILVAARYAPMLGAWGSARVAAGAAAAPGLMAAIRDPLGVGAALGGASTPGIVAIVERGVLGFVRVFSRVAGPIAIATAAIMSMISAFREFESVRAFVSGGAAYLVQSLHAVGIGFDMLFQKGSALNLIGGLLADTFGGLMYVVGGLLRVLGSLAAGLGLMLAIIGDGLKALWYVSTGDMASAAKIDIMGRFNDANAALRQIWGLDEPPKPGEDAPAGADLPKVAGTVNNFNGPVTVNVKTEINNDPARVVEAWRKGIDRVRLSSLQSRRLPALGGV